MHFFFVSCQSQWGQSSHSGKHIYLFSLSQTLNETETHCLRRRLLTNPVVANTDCCLKKISEEYGGHASGGGGWGISRDREVHLSLCSLNSPAARGLFCWDSHSLSYIQGKCAHKRLSTILLLISVWLKQVCMCVCARSQGRKIRLGAPCLSLMLHFHKKW